MKDAHYRFFLPVVFAGQAGLGVMQWAESRQRWVFSSRFRQATGCTEEEMVEGRPRALDIEVPKRLCDHRPTLC